VSGDAFMPGLDPGIHQKKALQSKKMDCRAKGRQ
jgi:hypothetical protein